MSVFSFDIAASNPVTVKDLDEACDVLGVSLKENEKQAYYNLLAVYHESCEKIMEMEDFIPPVDLERFPRENIHFPKPEENPHGAWAWRCTIEDKNPNSTGLLSGKTIALKDCISVKDVPMLLGTNFIQDYVPSTDATVVTRLLEAGATIAGMATCENMCHSATSHSAATGVVHNPYAKGYASGGSSSGSAALVALGEVDMAIGADQGGSIRVPAGWCGIYGLKPTYGLVSFTACASNEPTNDHVGPMTKDLLSNALLLQAIAGHCPLDDRTLGAPNPSRIPKYHDNLLSLPDPKSLKGIRIAIPTESLSIPALDPRVLDNFHSTVEKFRSLGATVTEVSIPMHKSATGIWTAISKLGGYLNKTGGVLGRRGYVMNDLLSKLHPMTQEQWDQAYPSTKNIYLNGAYAKKHFPGLLGKATNLSLKLRAAYDAILASEADVLLLPNLPYVANSHASPDASPLALLEKQVGLTSNTAPFNQSGHPVLAMPTGMLEIQEGPLKGSGVKLPVGCQVVGSWWDEEMVYRVAYAWSLNFDWKGL